MIRWLAGAMLALGGCSAPEAPPASSSGSASADRPTIVSLNPCADAILTEVAAPGQLLAISHYSKDPRASSMEADDARRYRATGGTVEEVLALDPDVVVASSFIAPATRAALTDLGIKVETIGSVASVEDSVAQVRQLALATGGVEAGEKLVGRMEAAVVPSSSSPIDTVLWQAGGIVPGDATLVIDLMQRAGLANGAGERGLAQADFLPLENVLADPPELLLVAGSERSQDHPALAALSETLVARLDPNLVYCGGPTIPRTMAKLRALRRSLDS
ncbi:MAG: ABC transporter substrate-binding protein [Erythrobacter sp.]|nr:ABC transporter substrate-binding protein [Erythrobacter sp.]